MKTLRDAFPTYRDLSSAPVIDVAFTMLEVLNSLAPGTFITFGNFVNAEADGYGHDRDAAARIMAEGWNWLESHGFVAQAPRQMNPAGRFVTRAGASVKGRADFAKYAQRALLPQEMLRPEMARAEILFLGGHYDEAVADAFKQVEVFVRGVCGYGDDVVGVALMRRAFDPDDGPLRDPSATKGEREAAAHLFAGAIGYYKNPFSHRNVGLSVAVQAASFILVANELLASADIYNRMRIARGG